MIKHQYFENKKCSPYFKSSTYALLHLQSMIPLYMMLAIQFFSLHKCVFIIHTAKNCSFPAHSRVGSLSHLCCIDDVCLKLTLGVNHSISLLVYTAIQVYIRSTHLKQVSQLLLFAVLWFTPVSSLPVHTHVLGKTGLEACLPDTSDANRDSVQN